MATFKSHFPELEIGKVKFSKGLYVTEDASEIQFLEKMMALHRYRITRVDAPKVAKPKASNETARQSAAVIEALASIEEPIKKKA